MDDFVDFSLDIADGPYYGRSFARALPRLVILYFALIFLCWNEIRFQNSAVDVVGHAEVVGRGRKGASMVCYSFIDPVSGRVRQNTVAIAQPNLAADGVVTVQVISGETISSRLKSQARPGVFTFVIFLHVICGAVLLGGIGFLCWEANHRPLTRQQKAMIAWKKRKRKKTVQAGY